MPIQYGELTIMFNKDDIDLFTNVMMWFHYEPAPPKKSKYIFLFEDGDIRDIDEDTLPKCAFTFYNGPLTPLPVYFERPKTISQINHPRYWHKSPFKKQKNDTTVLTMDSRPLFGAYSKYHISKCLPSCYNCIYYTKKVDKGSPEMFGLIRIQSNEYMPRYQFAYDSDEFTKDEVIYIIQKMLTQT